jgi:PAS domain S-box-containing protein
LIEKEKFRHLLEHQKLIQTSLDGFWVARAKDARILEANEAFCNMVGYSRAELLSMCISDLEAEESPEETAVHIKKIMAVGYDRFETRHRHKQGHLIELEVSVSYSESDGGVNFVFVRDITERKQMEQAIAARELAFRNLAENSPDFIVRYDHEHRMSYLNAILVRELELTSVDEVYGRRPIDVWPDGRFAAIDEAAARAMQTGEKVAIELCVSAENGGQAFHQIFVVPESNAGGEIIGTIAFGRDITAIREAENQLRALTAHLQSVREEERTRLAREIHDDLGSTLAALKLRLSHLLDFELSESMKDTTLFARLESMSQILESAIAATRRIVTDMRPDVLDNLGLFAALKWQGEQFYKHTGIECRIVCANDNGCLDCKGCEYQLDKTLSINLFRIFQEALSNVARHSGASKVEAEYRPEAGHVVLIISDDGCGLPEGHVPAPTSFGMRGMRERVGKLGGQIKFESMFGGGLCVTVKLPFAAGDKDGAEGPA